MTAKESTVRQRKPTKADPADTETVTPTKLESTVTPAEETPKKAAKKSRKVRSRIEEDDETTPWLDVVRVISFLFVVSCGLSYLITNGESWFWGFKDRPDILQTSWWKQKYQAPTYMTLEELAAYDGSDPDKPVYLSIDGNIYDVSKGRHIYGPGGSYHWFAGVDASRGFVTGCFSTDRNGDLRGVEDMFLPLDNPDIDSKYWTAEELEKKRAVELKEAHRRVRAAVDNWAKFFHKSKKYHFVAKLQREPGWEGPLKPLCKHAQDGREFRKPPGAENEE
ncbi:heme steroid-binding domain protein [Grosmannia clavigera kw1407]|uniref:Heme steroid-binding domain protein n=1 Tax=Grosmannia clavigera (strain kw1407 / UAMH 11150) TaxID=655863 RepID=F0X722_GROCL|nr:heme steroid-binding domain protein [Grosmannia clavigera kw1407]EFX06317.1 heme steroid-binding domain protein [Grosmannia clavigera kw1407]